MDSFFRCAAECFGAAAARAAEENWDKLCELRVRADRPVTLNLMNRQHFVTRSGSVSETLPEDALVVGFGELAEAFARLCSYSVYKHMHSVANGFLTLPGGHRAGVCGTAVLNGGEVSSVTDVTSLNIRAAKEYIGCSSLLFDNADLSEGLLLCGSPSSGKTTLLRDAARRLSAEHLRRVSVIDERDELANRRGGRQGFDVGLADVYSGYPKSSAMVLAVRTMSPEFLVCDELTGADAGSVAAALNCGVSVVSSVHCPCVKAARRNASVRALAATGAFGRLLFLDGRIPAGISEAVRAEDIL